MILLLLSSSLLLAYVVLRLGQQLWRGHADYCGTPGIVDVGGAHYVAMMAKHYHQLYHMFLQLAKRFQFQTFVLQGPLYQQRIYLTQNPENIQYVLKTNFQNYVRGPNVGGAFMDLLGHGIFNADGESWSRQRKTASQIFHVKNFRDFFIHVFREEAQLLARILEQHAKAGTVVDLHALFHRFTLDSFARIAFGQDVCALKTFLDGDVTPVPFAAAFDTAQKITNARVFNPYWRWTEYLDGSHATMQHCLKIMNDFAYKVVRKRRQDPNSATYSDLLSLYMSGKADESGRAYTDEELRDVVMNMIIAGRDTTAQALSWTFYNLHLNPDVVQKIRQEIRTVFGDNNSFSSSPTYEEIKQMEYMHAVFSETLRLYPSVPKQGKTALVDDQLPDGTRVSAGSLVAWSSWVMGRHEALWGKDAEAFQPERFLNTTAPSPYKFISFNAGPRLCLGMNMAYMEAITALSIILDRFHVQLAVPPEAIAYQTALTLPMKDGLPVYVSQRV